MSDMGPLTFGKKEDQIFLGREISQHRDYSEDTAIKIDHKPYRSAQHRFQPLRRPQLQKAAIIQSFSHAFKSGDSSMRTFRPRTEEDAS